MMSKEQSTIYDAMVVFDSPIEIMTDSGERISIFGLLYEKERKHKDDLWTWQLNRYICYLQGCQRIQERGGRLAPELWISSKQNLLTLRTPLKNLIYRIIKHRMIGYRQLEFTRPLEIRPTEHEDLFLTSSEPLTRYDLKGDMTIKDMKQ